MALKLHQRGTGSALVVCAGPMPHAGQPWELPAAALEALGPVPCVVGCAAPRPLTEKPVPGAKDDETLDEIMRFAEEQVGRRLWLAALLGFSAGCRWVRALWLAGAAALAVILADGLHAAKPPDPYQINFGREIVAKARAGELLALIEHTYIDVGPKKMSTIEMARAVTGWPLAMPPMGQTVRRIEAPPLGSPSWSGLIVYSTGTGPSDRQAHDAHEAQALRVLPVALRDRRIQQLFELPARPDVPAGGSAVPEATPEPPAEIVLEAGAPMPKSSPAPKGSARADGATVMLIGDSLAQNLGPALATVARDVPINNFAASGKQSTRVRDWDTSALPAVLGTPAPRLVLVCLGTNDLRQNDAGSAGARTGALIDRIRAAGVGDVAWIGPPELSGDDGAFRAALAQACAERSVRLFNSQALDLAKRPDGVHLASAANTAWANAIATWVPFSAYAEPTPDAGTGALPGPPAPALLALLAQLDATWPKRQHAGGGILPSAEHSRKNPESDHEPGNALDIPLDAGHGPDLDALAQALLRDSRTHYVIWNRRIANNAPMRTGKYRWEAGEWRRYPTEWMIEHGSANANPHTDHLHVSVYASGRDDTSVWDLASAGGGGRGPSSAELPAPVPIPASPRAPISNNEPLPGSLAPPAPPFRPGEKRPPPDPTEPLGIRAARFSIDEQRSGVVDGSPRIQQYRRGMGDPEDAWDASAFSFAAQQVLQPSERLPHAYSPLVSSLVRTGRFHPLGDGYEPRTGDGAIWAYYGDPTVGGAATPGGRVERVLVAPGTEDDPASFETIAGDAHGRWEQRAHRTDEPTLRGWLEYPQTKLPTVPDTIVVEDMGVLPFEEYVARVVTGELGMAREPQALMALAMAARSYAVWIMANEGLGTTAKPMPNSPKKQVVAGLALAALSRILG